MGRSVAAELAQASRSAASSEVKRSSGDRPSQVMTKPTNSDMMKRRTITPPGEPPKKARTGSRRRCSSLLKDRLRFRGRTSQMRGRGGDCNRRAREISPLIQIGGLAQSVVDAVLPAWPVILEMGEDVAVDADRDQFLALGDGIALRLGRVRLGGRGL